MSQPNGRYFTEAGSVEAVTSRNAQCSDPRLREVVDVLVRKLHEAVKEIEPSEAEWMAAIQFLTRTGHMCSDWRQEFILLSDAFGVSMLVDAINNRKPSGASESTVLGPFHVAGLAESPMGTNICKDATGEPMVVHGRILDREGHAIANAIIDVWQANDEGFYDVQQKGIQPENNLRAVFRTGADGRYLFKAVKPKFYPIPDDGPVGQLLRDLGRHPYRPAHLHYRIAAAGFATLVTHIFDPHCPYIGSDAVFGVKESLLARFERIDDTAAARAHGFVGAPYWAVEHDFVLSRDDAI